MDTPAGWYPDPLGRYEHRYWDGAQWTDNASRGGETITDPLDGSAPVVQHELGAQAAPPAQQYADPHADPGAGWSQPAAAPGGTEGLAIVSLILSIVWIFGLGSIAGIVTGIIARRRIRESGGTKTGNGIAVAGIVVGILTLGLTVLFFLALSLFAVWGSEVRTVIESSLPALPVLQSA